MSFEQVEYGQRVLILGGWPQLKAKATKLGLVATQISLKDFDKQAIIASHSDRPFSMIIGQYEPGVLEAAQLAYELGVLGTNLDVATVMADKWKMRQALVGTHLDTVAARLVENVYECWSFCESGSFSDVILKPRAGTGSWGVFSASTFADMNTIFEFMAKHGEVPFLAEERKFGREFSVETFSDAGAHLAIAITEKFISDEFVELGHVLPAEVTAEEKAKIEQAAFDLLDFLGHKTGPAHTEVMLDGQSVHIVESHPRRGGDHINELVEIAYGIDIEEWTFSILLGLAKLPEGPLSAMQASAVYFFQSKSGRVQAIKGVEEAQSIDGVRLIDLRVEVGDIVDDFHSSGDRVGSVVVAADTPNEALTFAKRMADSIQISVD